MKEVHATLCIGGGKVTLLSTIPGLVLKVMNFDNETTMIVRPMKEKKSKKKVIDPKKRLAEVMYVSPHIFAHKMKTSILYAVEIINRFESANKGAEHFHWFNMAHGVRLNQDIHKQLARDIAGRPE